MTKQYEFSKDLLESQSDTTNPMFWKIYEGMFPELMHFYQVEDKALQMKQVDRVLIMNNQANLRIEEKIDKYKNNRIALELWSNYDKKTPGWLFKPSLAHWLLYIKTRLGLAIFLPPKALREAYENNKAQWHKLAEANMDDFKIGRADNGSYHSVCICVPIDVLVASTKEARVIRYAEAGEASL